MRADSPSWCGRSCCSCCRGCGSTERRDPRSGKEIVGSHRGFSDWLNLGRRGWGFGCRGRRLRRRLNYKFLLENVSIFRVAVQEVLRDEGIYGNEPLARTEGILGQVGVELLNKNWVIGRVVFFLLLLLLLSRRRRSFLSGTRYPLSRWMSLILITIIEIEITWLLLIRTLMQWDFLVLGLKDL